MKGPEQYSIIVEIMGHMSMKDAKDRADLVFFDDPVTRDLARVIETAGDLHKRGKLTVDERFAGAKLPSAEAIDALIANLEDLAIAARARRASRGRERGRGRETSDRCPNTRMMALVVSGGGSQYPPNRRQPGRRVKPVAGMTRAGRKGAAVTHKRRWHALAADAR
jgi:hypothetical protein